MMMGLKAARDAVEAFLADCVKVKEVHVIDWVTKKIECTHIVENYPKLHMIKWLRDQYEIGFEQGKKDAEVALERRERLLAEKYKAFYDLKGQLDEAVNRISALY